MTVVLSRFSFFCANVCNLQLHCWYNPMLMTMSIMCRHHSFIRQKARCHLVSQQNQWAVDFAACIGIYRYFRAGYLTACGGCNFGNFCIYLNFIGDIRDQLIAADDVNGFVPHQVNFVALVGVESDFALFDGEAAPAIIGADGNNVVAFFDDDDFRARQWPRGKAVMLNIFPLLKRFVSPA